MEPGPARVHVLIADKGADTRRMIRALSLHLSPEGATVVVVSNKWGDVEDLDVFSAATASGLPCCVANLKTGQGVVECMELIKTFAN
jgi:hypothetical protein